MTGFSSSSTAWVSTNKSTIREDSCPALAIGTLAKFATQAGEPACRLCRPDRHQLLGALPELPVNEIRGEAAQERQLSRLPGPDLEDAGLQQRKGLLHQFIGADHAAAALSKLCR